MVSEESYSYLEVHVVVQVHVTREVILLKHSDKYVIHGFSVCLLSFYHPMYLP